jgi:NADH-quinone oxidoreductase subunit G
VVVVWGDRIGRELGAVERLLDFAAVLGLEGKEGSGLLEVPDFANSRGLREAGCLPDAGPGLVEVAGGRDSERIRAALESGDLDAVLLFGVDPLRDFPDTPAWDRALTAADVISFSMFETATTAKADVVLPLETHAEKDGTVTHPDGRLQRVRPSASRPAGVRSNIQVLSELALALGLDTGITSQPSAFAALTTAVPFYNGITDQQIGGRGIRWQEGPGAANAPALGAVGVDSADATRRVASTAEGEAGGASRGVSAEPTPTALAGTDSGGLELALGTYRDLWAGPITELNPPLKFLAPRQTLELSLGDAERLQVKTGDLVSVGQGGSSVEAEVQIRERVPAGVCFLSEGVADGNANALLNGGPVSVEIRKLNEVVA